MRTPSRRDALALGAAAAAVAAGGSASAAAAAPGDMNLGDPKAPAHLVVYLSLTCPHCAHFWLENFAALKAKYVDTGKVYLTVRELLTSPAPVAAAGVLMARCNGAPPQRYFKVVEDVFRSQSRWQTGNIKPIFLEIAKANGLTEAQFEACLTDEAGQKALQGRVDYAVNTDKVNGTPTFFVNGVRVEGDVHDLAGLEPAIAKASQGRRR